MAKTGSRSRSLRRGRPPRRPDLCRIERKLKRMGGRFAALARRAGFVFLTDREMARLAGHYRGERRPTDVLAFAYGGPGLAGEIFISLDTAGRQASERGMRLEPELILLVMHGLLHLAGFDDEKSAPWRKMKKAEFEAMMRIL